VFCSVVPLFGGWVSRVECNEQPAADRREGIRKQINEREQRTSPKHKQKLGKPHGKHPSIFCCCCTFVVSRRWNVIEIIKKKERKIRTSPLISD
jgi:hypothetical protein